MKNSRRKVSNRAVKHVSAIFWLWVYRWS